MSQPRKKPGRAKLPPSEKRGACVFIYLTPGEFRAFKKMAAPEPHSYVARRILLRWMAQEREKLKQSRQL